MERPVIGEATEQERASGTLMLAFANDPLLRWMFPDPQQYRTHFPELMRHFAGGAFGAGTAHEASGYRAVALWLPPGVHSDEEALGEFAGRAIDEARQPELFGLLEQVGAIHPTEPHWYLPVIGVDPVSQGQGLGSALLAHALAECDAQHLPAYLESSNPRNNPLYERHGFEVMEVLQLGDSPQVWPMYRKAR